MKDKKIKSTEVTKNNKAIKYCFRCGTILKKSPVEGYTYFCPNCYEDFYEFEQQ